MSSTATRIFNGSSSTNGITVTDSFPDTSFFYIVAPDITDEVEIDAFLQIILPEGTRLVPLGKYILDSREIIVFPSELRNSGLAYKFCLLGDAFTSVNLEIWAVSCDCCNKQEIDAIKSQLDLLQLQLVSGLGAIAINQLGQDAALVSIAGALGLGLAPLTGGASLALPGLVTKEITPGATAIANLVGILPGSF